MNDKDYYKIISPGNLFKNSSLKEMIDFFMVGNYYERIIGYRNMKKYPIENINVHLAYQITTNLN